MKVPWDDPNHDVMGDILRFCCPPCWHDRTTEADGTGRAICLRCGLVVRTKLTMTDLELALDRLLYGVSFEDAWGNRIDPKDVHAGPAEESV